MGRLRQLHPQNYPNSGNVHDEFESIVRYLNAAELGNRTVSELLSTLFNADGEFDGPIQFRLDGTDGLQYRIGEYANEDDGWLTIVDIADIRGPSGSNVGTIEGPLFYNRVDYEVTSNGTTNIPYSFDELTDTIIVFKDGVLLAEETSESTPAEYTPDPDNNQVILASAVNDGTIITIYSVRAQSVTNFRRTDYEAVATVSQVAFGHTPEERLLVYRNGILQREGGSNDYTTDPATDVITFMTPLNAADVVTIYTVENNALLNVGGLMLEDVYTDANGLIPYSKLAIADAAVPQAKINGLVSALAAKAKLTVSGTPPGTPASGDLWLDTGISPNQLKFYDGSGWVRTNPESTLPSFDEDDAGRYVKVNGTGTGLEYGTVDLSSVVPVTDVGTANGVASLDSDAKVPLAQIPDIYSPSTIGYYNSGTETNGTKFVSRLWKQKTRIDGIALKLASGTCTVQLAVDGVTLSALGTFNVTSAAQDVTFGTIAEIDATTAAKRLELVITNASTPIGLEVGIAGATLNI